MEKRTANTERNYDLKVSTGILVDYLISEGYEIVSPFKVESPCIRRYARFEENATNQASTLFIASAQTDMPTEDGISPVVLFLEKEESVKNALVEKIIETRSKICIIKATKTDQSINHLFNDIQGCFLSIEEYAYKSALGLSAPKPLQTLVDVAEKEFGLFISIVDCNYMLLAYTRNIKPIDDVNQSLIKLGYHSDEILFSQRGGGYLSDEIKQQKGIKEYPASQRIPCALITTPLFLQQRYAGLVVMTTEKNSFSTGQKDLFEMFVGFCTMALKRNIGLSTIQGDPDQEFLLHMISMDNLDKSYIRRQFSLLDIPTTGFYQMALMEINRDMSSQVGFILNEMRSIKSVYILPAVYEGSLVVLFNAQKSRSIKNSMEELLCGRAGEYLERVYTSELFSDFCSINIAYKSLLVERDYAPLAVGPFWEEDLEQKKVLSFAEVFTFVMIDPEGDPAVKYFAASNTIIEQILLNDAEKKTNDFELLAAYLSKGDKASRIANLFHLHRNGVSYRIERIQNQFDINLEKPEIRNYVQMAIFCKIAMDPHCARKILRSPEKS